MSLATVSTSVGEIDLAIVLLIFVAVATTRASSVVFYDDEEALSWKTLFLNFVHMLALTVMAYAVVQLAAAVGWQMRLGGILLTGGTFGWTGPKINQLVADLWITVTKAVLSRPDKRRNGDEQ